jgi:hypothetical protein
MMVSPLLVPDEFVSSSDPTFSRAAYLRCFEWNRPEQKRFRRVVGTDEQENAVMVFKERTFYGQPPEGLAGPDQADLETRVANCLATVDGLDASDVVVVSKGNTIVLSGTVASIEEAERAEEAARTVEGVAEIVNRITVA